MIQKIKLHNFQAHEKTELELHPGINAIVGTSDSGKTAILRSLYWAVNNRPSGDSFASYWIKDGEKLIGECSVEIVRESGIIKRYKNKKTNAYEINGNALEALRTDVPDEIKSFFNLSEVNIQRQMDAPFLIAESAGEIARFFNRVLRLEEIDGIMATAEKLKREASKKEIENAEKIKELEASISKFSFLDDISEKINRAEKLQGKIQEAEIQINILKKTYSDYQDMSDRCNKFKLLGTAENALILCHAEMENLKKVESEMLILNSSISECKIAETKIDKAEKIIPVSSILEKLEDLQKKNEKISAEIAIIKQMEIQYSNAESEMFENENNIKALELCMPDICPLCGGKL